MATTSIRVDNDARSGPGRVTYGTFHHQEQISVASLLTAAQITGTTFAAGLVSDWVPCDGLTDGVLYINPVTLDATTIEVQLEFSPDRTLVAPGEFVEGTDTAGVRTSTPEQEQFTAANYTAGVNAAIKLAFTLHQPTHWYRVKIKRTGGSSAGSTIKLFWAGACLP